MHVKDLAARYEAAAKATAATTPERAPVTTEKVSELRDKLERAVTEESPRRVEAAGFEDTPELRAPRSIAEGTVGKVAEKFEVNGLRDEGEGDDEHRTKGEADVGELFAGNFAKSFEQEVEVTGIGGDGIDARSSAKNALSQSSGHLRKIEEAKDEDAKELPSNFDGGNDAIQVSRRKEARNVHIQAMQTNQIPEQTPSPSFLPSERQSTPNTNLTEFRQTSTEGAPEVQVPASSENTPQAHATSLSAAAFSVEGSFSSYTDSTLEPIIPPPNITDVDELDHIEGVERVDDEIGSASQSSPSLRRNATVEELSDEEGGVFSGEDDGFKDAPLVKHSSDGSSRPSAATPLQTPSQTFKPQTMKTWTSSSEQSPNSKSRSTPSSSQISGSSYASQSSTTSSQLNTSGSGNSLSSARRLKKSGTITSVDDLSSHGSFESAGSDFPHTAPSALTARRKQTPESRIHSLPRIDSTATHSTHRTGGSFRLPKAKVVIARKRDPNSSQEHEYSTDDGEKTDGSGARKLVRVYENHRDLITGQVSMLDVVSDEEETEPVNESKDMVGGGALVPSRRKNPYRKRYDEFLDAEQLGPRPLLSDEDPTLEDDRFAPKGASKQRYRSRWFGKSEKKRAERHERHAENVQRRSTILSGALDRVSMAADPWIDFITDNPAAKNKRPWNLMKRLFKRRGNELIKD